MQKLKEPTPVNHWPNKTPDYVGLTLVKAKELRAKIKDKYGTLAEFCKFNTYVSQTSLSEILRCERKTKPKTLARIEKDLSDE